MDSRHHAGFAFSQHRESLRCIAHPLHREVLKREEQVAQIAPRDLHLVTGKREAQRFAVLRPGEQGCDEVLIREDVEFAAGRLNAQAGGGGLTVPADWCGGIDRLVGF